MQINELIKLAEKTLSIVLPIEYIICTKDGIFNRLYNNYEVFFLDEKMVNFNISPCAIGVTKKFREEKILPEINSIALGIIDNKLYFLNTNTDRIGYEYNNSILDTDTTLFNWVIDIISNSKIKAI